VIPARRYAVILGAAMAAVVIVGAVTALAKPHESGAPSTSLMRQSGHAAFRGARVPAGHPAPNFRLTTEQGAKLRLSAQKGKFVLLAFLYTKCQDVCPIIAIQLDNVVRSLGQRGKDVQILAVSVDPEGDTPKAVRAYLRSHHLGSDFHWLLGTRQQLWPVWRAYNVAVSPAQGSDAIAHTAPVLLLDRTGRPRVYYPEPLDGWDVAHDLRLLIRASR